MSEKWKKLRESVLILCCQCAIRANVARTEDNWDDCLMCLIERDAYSGILSLMERIENECNE